MQNMSKTSVSERTIVCLECAGWGESTDEYGECVCDRCGGAGTLPFTDAIAEMKADIRADFLDESSPRLYASRAFPPVKVRSIRYIPWPKEISTMWRACEGWSFHIETVDGHKWDVWYSSYGFVPPPCGDADHRRHSVEEILEVLDDEVKHLMFRQDMRDLDLASAVEQLDYLEQVVSANVLDAAELQEFLRFQWQKLHAVPVGDDGEWTYQQMPERFSPADVLDETREHVAYLQSLCDAETLRRKAREQYVEGLRRRYEKRLR